MQMMEQEIQRLTPMIWESILRLPMEPATQVPAAAEQTLSSFVHITGAWNGAVVLECGMDFAAHAARIMFNLGDHEPTRADIQDALGELANIIGGNIKGLCPEPCHLSLPFVAEGPGVAIRFPGARLVTKIPFYSGRSLISVSLYQREVKDAA